MEGVALATSFASLRSLFAGQQTKLGLKCTTKSVRRRQGGGHFCSEQLKLVASAVASTESAVATSSTTTTTTSVLGLEVVESLQPNSRVRVSPSRCGRLADEWGNQAVDFIFNHSQLRELEIPKEAVPPKVVKDIYNDVIKEYSKKTKVPGFRPGKRIPESVLVNYIGPQAARSSAVEAILKKSLPEALSSVAGQALKESEHIVSKFQDLESSFLPDTSLSYDVAVDVAPEVKWKSENAYKNLKVTVALDPTPIPEEAADAEFKSRVKGLGSLQVAPDRGLEMGDVAIIDISANRLNADGTEGEKVLSAEQKGFQLDTEDFANFISGFVGALFNIRREETQNFDLVFPQTWQQTALRGINACFTEIFVRQLPELDDTIAPKFMEGLTTLDQVKEVLLEKHRISIEQAKLQQTQLSITEELAKFRAAVTWSENEAVIELKHLFALASAYGFEDWLQFATSVVRGLAYYTGTVFEAFDKAGKLCAICGGGRYDRLLSTFGGSDTPACGFGFGDAVIIELLKERGLMPNLSQEVDDIVLPMEEQLRPQAAMVVARLRASGRSVDIVMENKK